MARLVLSLVAVVIVCPSLKAQAVSSHARDAVQTIGELRAIGLPDNPEGVPPAKVPSLLRRLNRELRELVIEILNDHARRGAPSDEEITEQLRAAGWEEVPNIKWNAYGEIVDIDFDLKSGYEPGILLVTTQLWIPCGTSDPDTAVYVFQGRARRWELVLAADADFDALQQSQFGGLQSAISPPDENGHWFLAVAHVPPSCRHVPSYLRYKILRPGRSADTPVALIESRVPVDPEFEPPFKIRTEEDWFALTRGKRRKLDGESGISIARYEVKDQEARRIHPLALWPEDFLDEWVQLSWDEASQWSNSSKLSSIQAWHSQLQGLKSDSAEIRVVQPCPKQQELNDRWMINLWIDRQMNPRAAEEELYVEVSRKQGIFYVDGIQTSRPSGCPGNMPPTALPDLKLPSW